MPQTAENVANEWHVRPDEHLRANDLATLANLKPVVCADATVTLCNPYAEALHRSRISMPARITEVPHDDRWYSRPAT